MAWVAKPGSGIPGPRDRASTAIFRAWRWLLLLCLAAAPAVVSLAQQSREYDLKAAFIYQFTKFVEWPESAFTGTNSPIVIGILGEDPFDGALSAVTKDEFVGGRPIVVKRLEQNDRLEGCHLVFVGRTEAARAQLLIRNARTEPILTVSDASNFATRGGMVELFIENNKIRFRVNPDATRQAQLRISSKLLRLGEVVETKL